MTPLEQKQARRIADLEAELTEALTKLQALTIVAETVRSNLAAIVAQVTDGTPAPDLVADLGDIDPPTDDGGAEVLPFTIPARRSTPAAASAEVDHTAPTI